MFFLCRLEAMVRAERFDLRPGMRLLRDESLSGPATLILADG
jgi:hypothetical protein